MRHRQLTSHEIMRESIRYGGDVPSAHRKAQAKSDNSRRRAFDTLCCAYLHMDSRDPRISMNDLEVCLPAIDFPRLVRLLRGEPTPKGSADCLLRISPYDDSGVEMYFRDLNGRLLRVARRRL